MKNQEYIELHPEQFKDDIDKWLFNEFSIIGGCSSAQGSMEYSVARRVAEKLFKAQEIADKAYFESCEKLRNIHIAMIKELKHKWSLGDSTEAKYKAEAYQELLDIFKEE